MLPLFKEKPFWDGTLKLLGSLAHDRLLTPLKSNRNYSQYVSDAFIENIARITKHCPQNITSAAKCV